MARPLFYENAGHSPETTTLTREGIILGSPDYMAPEKSRFFFYNDTPPPEFYPLSLHAPLPIWVPVKIPPEGRHPPGRPAAPHVYSVRVEFPAECTIQWGRGQSQGNFSDFPGGSTPYVQLA